MYLLKTTYTNLSTLTEKNMNDDLEIVLSLCKEYINEYDMFYVAKDDKIYHWGSEDTISRKGWVVHSPREVINIIKSTRIPFGLMKHLTNEVLLGAFQEEARTYIQACDTFGVTPKGFFNFNTMAGEGGKTSIETIICNSILIELEDVDQNIKWVEVTRLFGDVVKHFGIKYCGVQDRNKFLRKALENSTFEERSLRRGVNGRYYYFCKDQNKYMQLTCIKLPHRSGYMLLKESGIYDAVLQRVINSVARFIPTE